MKRARSEKRREWPDHTRITLLEDDADNAELRIRELELAEIERGHREAALKAKGISADAVSQHNLDVRLALLALAPGAIAIVVALAK